MMLEVPTPAEVVFALLAAGALFLLRFALALRRLRAPFAHARRNGVWDDARRATLPGTFGAGHEPERRYAVRQLYAGAAFGAAGLAAAGWMLVASVLGPFVSRATGG